MADMNALAQNALEAVRGHYADFDFRDDEEGLVTEKTVSLSISEEVYIALVASKIVEYQGRLFVWADNYVKGGNARVEMVETRPTPVSQWPGYDPKPASAPSLAVAEAVEPVGRSEQQLREALTSILAFTRFELDPDMASRKPWVTLIAKADAALASPPPASSQKRGRPLEWSEPIPPNTYCSYHHVFADTPFGRYQIEWKGWKDHPCYTLMFRDSDFIPAADDLDMAKTAAQADYEARITAALSPDIQGRDHIPELGKMVPEAVKGDGWQPIETARKVVDETVLLRLEHVNYAIAGPDDKHRWEEVCTAYWTDFNGGGWVWHGLAGTPTHWRDVPEPPSLTGEE